MDTHPDSAIPELRVKAEKLGEELAVRRSVTYIATGLVCCMVAIITFGLSMRLFIDSAKPPRVFWVVLPVCVVSLVASLRGFFKGWRLRLDERARFRQYLELREKAGLDL